MFYSRYFDCFQNCGHLRIILIFSLNFFSFYFIKTAFFQRTNLLQRAICMPRLFFIKIYYLKYTLEIATTKKTYFFITYSLRNKFKTAKITVYIVRMALKFQFFLILFPQPPKFFVVFIFVWKL